LYDGVIKKAVKAIKYRRVSSLASEFVSLSSVYPNSIKLPFSMSDTILIPVPLHPLRLRYRGFNQAEVLGRIVAARLNIAIETGMLHRAMRGTPQVAMKTRKMRLGNMKAAFRALGQVKNTNIMLFDDVFTTGATVCSAANTLKRAGAGFVWAITMAR